MLKAHILMRKRWERGGVVYVLIMGYEGSLGTSFSVNINNLRNTKTEHLNKLETTNQSKKSFSLISIYILCLSICMFVCLFGCLFGCSFVFIQKKRMNRSGPNFVWDLTWPQGMFMNCQISKISLQQNSIFIKFWKYTKFFDKIRKFFCFLFCFTIYKKRKCSQLK